MQSDWLHPICYRRGPAVVADLTGSTIWVGGLSTVLTVAGTLPQLLVAALFIGMGALLTGGCQAQRFLKPLGL